MMRMSQVVRAVLGSGAIWKLSGLSYPTAVLATRGRIESVSEYIAESREQMAQLPIEGLRGKKVLEFGCGVGGNLIAISDCIEEGVGVDINRWFTKRAAKVAKSVGVRNVRFIALSEYDHGTSGLCDVAFSIGVFERLDRQTVGHSISLMSKWLAPGGRLFLYFLAPRARGSTFTSWLGESAYRTWSVTEVESLARSQQMLVEARLPWRPANLGIASRPDSVADLYVFTKQVGRGSQDRH